VLFAAKCISARVAAVAAGSRSATGCTAGVRTREFRGDPSAGGRVGLASQTQSRALWVRRNRSVVAVKRVVYIRCQGADRAHTAGSTAPLIRELRSSRH